MKTIGKFLLLIIPFLLTVIMRIVVFIGVIRLNFGMSDELDTDMGFIVPDTARWLNMFWDLMLGRYPDQPHHKPVAVFFTAIMASLTTIKLLFLSLFSWKR
ncbi:MAG: hypothetical protein ACD_19C00140G0006 [uncultured bacterium]|nr:MAG: hypothetical protein ACD_19C00140G0006 [uncultured bacterium]